MALDLSGIPIVDHHCHSLLRVQPRDDVAFRNHLTETYIPEMARDHVQHTLVYHWAIRELAAFLGCEATPGAVHAARLEWGVERLAREVAARGNFKTWLIDTGYGAETTFSLDELRAMASVVVGEILRLEPLIERLILEAASFSGFLEAYRGALVDLRGAGYVGMKSVIAYRTGLHVGTVGRSDAKAAFKGVHEAARRDGRLRIASKPLLDFLIVAAVEEAARQAVPIQFHTGLGDPDLDLTQVDPAALRLLFADAYRAAPIVLLHTGYPHVRSMAYLAAMYPNVYADFGEVQLFVAGDLREIARELLGLAPASKILFSTDASLVPELYWLGALAGRRTFGQVLAEHVAEGLLDERTALGMAELILWRNAQRVYQL
ncbi:MAG: amidohydrolase family protein [Candidatus Limnocylindrales bacterium]